MASTIPYFGRPERLEETPVPRIRPCPLDPRPAQYCEQAAEHGSLARWVVRTRAWFLIVVCAPSQRLYDHPPARFALLLLRKRARAASSAGDRGALASADKSVEVSARSAPSGAPAQGKQVLLEAGRKSASAWGCVRGYPPPAGEHACRPSAARASCTRVSACTHRALRKLRAPC